MVVVREGTEGPYAGSGGLPARGRRTRWPPRRASTRRTASSGSCATPSPGRRRRPRQQLTLVHKTNVLVYAGGLWQRTVDRVARSSPTSPSTTATSTPRRCSSSPTRSGSTWSSPTTSSATSSPTSAPRSPAASGSRPAATWTSPDQPEHVRAGPRLGAGHRRPGQGRPDRHRLVGRDAPRPPRPSPTRPRRSRRPWPPTWRRGRLRGAPPRDRRRHRRESRLKRPDVRRGRAAVHSRGRP